MKQSRIVPRALVFGVLLILLVFASSLAAVAQDAPSYAPWRDYVLVVEIASDDPETVSYKNDEKPDARYVMVRVRDMSLPIKIDDITEGYTEFALRDKKSTEYPAETFGLTTLRIVNNQLSTDIDQDAFALFFDVPADIPLADLTLFVDTKVPTEHVTVSLSKVPNALP